jgi:hypothetical protein
VAVHEVPVVFLETRQIEITATDDTDDVTVREEECTVEGQDDVVNGGNEVAQQRSRRGESILGQCVVLCVPYDIGRPMYFMRGATWENSMKPTSREMSFSPQRVLQ